MRVTFNAFPDTLLGRLQSLGREQNKALVQLSSGQRIDAPSDDAPAMQRVLNLRTEKKQNQQFYRNATDGLERSKVSFSSLEQIKDLLVRASELSANISGASSEQEYRAKAAEIDQLVQQGVNVANTKLRGNYLFSGDTTLKQPFLANTDSSGKVTSVAYDGGDQEVKIRIGEGETSVLPVATQPSENEKIADVLNAMIEMRDKMRGPASTDKVRDVLEVRAKFATLEDDTLSALSRAGTIQYRLETAMKDLESRYEATEQLISVDADVDFAEATVRLNRAQTAYQAAIQSGANIQSRSLLDYLR
jgi:flagellar hook-associated protein 3 FlgL